VNKTASVIDGIAIQGTARSLYEDVQLITVEVKDGYQNICCWPISQLPFFRKVPV
jgi:hypothetical protein